MIETRKLHHIVTLAKAGSYVRAAQALNLSQPALTRSIQSAEQRFGVVLFDRGRSGVTPTAIGARVIAEAEQLLRDADLLERNVKLMGVSQLGDIALGMDPLVAGIFLADTLSFLGQAHRNLRVQVIIQAGNVLEQQLLAHDIEFFVTPSRLATDNTLFVREPLVSVPVGPLVRPGHPLLTHASVGMQEISRYPLIAGSLPEHLRQAGDAPALWSAASIRCDDYGLMRDVALHSDALWLASPVMAKGATPTDTLQVLPVNDPALLPSADLIVVSLKGLSRSPAAKLVLRKLTELSANI